MVLIFLTVAPALIGYGVGWRYNSATHNLEKVSALSITSTPRGATVFVDGEIQKKLTPFSINNLYANDYHIRIEKNGYFAWEKSVQTYADRVTRLPNATLVKQQTFDTELITSEIQSISPSPSGMFIAILNETTLTLFQNTGSKLWASEISLSNADLQWSLSESRLLITYDDTALPPLLIETATGTQLPIAESIPQNILDYSWSRENDVTLYARSESTTYEIRLPDLSFVPLEHPPLEQYNGVDMRIVRERETASWERADGQRIATLPIPMNHTMSIVAHNNALFVHDITSQKLYTVDMSARQSKLLLQGVITFMWGTERHELLYASANEVWLYDPETITETLILRTSQGLSFAQLMVNDHYIGYVVPDQGLTILEIGDLPRNTYSVFPGTVTGLVTMPNQTVTLLSTESAVYQMIFE